jgi:cell division protein DivIC
MDTFKNFYTRIKPYLNKYIITLVVFAIFIVFIDDNNVIRRVQYEIQIKGLRKEIRHYEKERDEDSLKLQKLHSSDSELERIAREEYMMKKPNEEVFIVE